MRVFIHENIIYLMSNQLKHSILYKTKFAFVLKTHKSLFITFLHKLIEGLKNYFSKFQRIYLSKKIISKLNDFYKIKLKAKI